MGFMKRKKAGAAFNEQRQNEGRKAQKGLSAHKGRARQKGHEQATKAKAALAVACPYCKAKAGKPCMTSRGSLSRAIHADRIDLWAIRVNASD